MTSYSMWMLEYSHCLEHPVGCIFYGTWDGSTRKFAYSYVYIEGNGHRILVDVGHDNRGSNRAYNDENDIVDFQPPDVVLAKVGVKPEQIDTIILTHAHYDHAGAARYFPNATFYLQRIELESSRWALENAHLYASIIGALDPEDVRMLEEMADSGRLRLLDGPVENLFPGLHIRTALDTHTMGGQYVVVEDGSDNWVVTGDALYSYENAEGIGGSGVPVNIGFGGGSGWRGLQIIDEMSRTAGDTDRLVIVHEYDTFRRHPSRTYDDRLSVAELILAPGESSRID
ncbi:MBL fold metallo-hydrolase [Microbacterium sp. NPDC077644]|uniref:MBL fold metallo-hydrolase n=1 Tax=Microbacterium sp. NPDC077644 TaxID=3155055 RepID=UPI00344E79B7